MLLTNPFAQGPRVFVRYPAQVGQELLRAQMGSRVAMALKTPTHAQPLGLVDHVHLVHTAVARQTTHAARNVCTMVEINVVRQVMDADPLKRFLSGSGLAKGHEFLGIRSDCRVAVHASCHRRNGSRCGRFDSIVAVPAVDPQFTGMQPVAERDRLSWLITDVRGRWRSAVVDHSKRVEGTNGKKGPNQRPRSVNPCRKGRTAHSHSVARKWQAKLISDSSQHREGLPAHSLGPPCVGRRHPRLRGTHRTRGV